MPTTPFALFLHPPREFGLMPFWFWNDDLDEAELRRQLHEFHRAGFGGVLPHARTGLSKRVGYLTEEYFRLFRVVVEECARLDMKVILYDEGAYPSGSACGAVVAENPAHASQCLGLWQKEITGPWRGYWRPNTGRALLDQHVATVLAQVDEAGRVDPTTARLLPAQPHDVFLIETPAGRWKALSVWQVASGGHIRGVFAEQESQHATAPAAGDILNPDAVACFLRLTHDEYYRRLKEFFGTTIIAMFTDEPNPLGKGPHRVTEPWPYTPGFADWLAIKWGCDPRPWLPALWLDFGERTAEFRRAYRQAVADRLNEVFYRAQHEWCENHGIALTGHPDRSDEMAVLRHFHIPGQDTVWRAVLPNSPSALEGPHSTAAKAATSAARAHGRRRILTELGGAYGWQHSLDELKWLYDWHLVRGNNLLNPHAVFYSIRDRRAWESEPDIGVHNVWWPHFHHIARYAARVCWLLTDGEHVCDIGIRADPHQLPWRAAKTLYQNQIDFLYTDNPDRFPVILHDDEPVSLDKLPRDLRIRPANPDLRFIHYRKLGLDFYFLVNEGETAITGEVELRAKGTIEEWNPWTGERRELPGPPVPLHLERRASTLLVVNPTARPAVAPYRVGQLRTEPVIAEWDRPLGDWARQPGMELFTGTLAYRAIVEVPAAAELWLDLGAVGEIAEVCLNGVAQGVALWAPYRVRVIASAGKHDLEVRVTNSMANAYEGRQLPAGLMGPVRWIVRS